jgi:hypothetical protein
VVSAVHTEVNSKKHRIGWKEPALAVGILSLVVAILALGRDYFDVKWPFPAPSPTANAAPPTANTSAQPQPRVDERRLRQNFITSANSLCRDRIEKNLAIAKDIGFTGGKGDSLDLQLEFNSRVTGPTNDMISKIATLERPPGDNQKIDAMLDSLAQANLLMQSAIDAYTRFGPSSPTFSEDLDKAGTLEQKFNSSAVTYGLKDCG